MFLMKVSKNVFYYWVIFKLKMIGGKNEVVEYKWWVFERVENSFKIGGS